MSATCWKISGTVGKATGTLDKAEVIAGKMQSRIDAVAAKAQAAATRPRVLSLEWIEPLIYAGHWIPEMVEMAGGENCFGSKDAGSGPPGVERPGGQSTRGHHFHAMRLRREKGPSGCSLAGGQ